MGSSLHFSLLLATFSFCFLFILQNFDPTVSRGEISSTPFIAI
ncbi:hypothetical protein Gotri_025017 [Gossypium trilobum]|uniref:Uncharacterized protein n=1 Tax=Gossypium trilobum TaxID=34281 RepID=A0A7J9FUP0_9ROSI|nr:hypothetical protein [Gossypium trilobum]